MEIIILIIIFGLGVMYGTHITTTRVKDNLQRMADKIDEDEAMSTIPVTFEFMDDQKQVFCYHADEKNFLAQSDTVEDCLKRVQERFPNKELICEKSELEAAVKRTTSWKTK